MALAENSVRPALKPFATLAQKLCRACLETFCNHNTAPAQKLCSACFETFCNLCMALAQTLCRACLETFCNLHRALGYQISGILCYNSHLPPRTSTSIDGCFVETDGQEDDFSPSFRVTILASNLCNLLLKPFGTFETAWNLRNIATLQNFFLDFPRGDPLYRIPLIVIGKGLEWD